MVWLVLLLATFATWWLGAGHTWARGASWELVLLLAAAFGKVYLVGTEFMELRHAPRTLHFTFALWVVVFGLGAMVLALF